MNTTVENMLTELLPKASVQELIERYGDPYYALLNAEEAEWYDTPGMGNRGIAKLRAIKSLIKNVQNRNRKAPLNVSRPKEIYKAMADMQYFETEHVHSKLIVFSLLLLDLKHAELLLFIIIHLVILVQVI